MSKIDRKYYKWNDSESDFGIKLGMNKSELLSANVITEIIANEELEYEGNNGCPWRINFKDDIVEQIWFNSLWHQWGLCPYGACGSQSSPVLFMLGLFFCEWLCFSYHDSDALMIGFMLPLGMPDRGARAWRFSGSWGI